MSERFHELIKPFNEIHFSLNDYMDFPMVSSKVEALPIKLNQLNYLVDKGNMKIAVKRLWDEKPKAFSVLQILITVSTKYKNIWARKLPKVPHKYNYELMRAINDGRQMTDVWRLPAIARWEKSCGKHPTQKPLALLTRIILASTDPNDWILDPFAGSSTTGIAANLCGRRFLGIERDLEFSNLSCRRRMELDDDKLITEYKNKISDFKHFPSEITVNEPEGNYGTDLPF